jgi:adenylate cyclase
MRLNLRNKLLLFAVVIAVLPLLIAGATLIRIASDELKSSANDRLVATARQVTEEIDDIYTDAWLSPLTIIANAIDDDRLDIESKIALLTLGTSNIPGVVALQITVLGKDTPLLVSTQKYSEKLADIGLSPNETLKTTQEQMTAFLAGDNGLDRGLQHVDQTDIWLATIVLPLRNKLAGAEAILSARIDLTRIKKLALDQRLMNTGSITIVDKQGKQLFTDATADLSEFEIVNDAINLLSERSRMISVKPYVRPDGEVMLGAFSFPRPFDWVVITEKSEADAYYITNSMRQSLLLWIAAGLAVAGLGAVLLSLDISRPILKIGQAVIEVGHGNFQSRVEDIRSKDEIGELASRINDMIGQIEERFKLAKFVSLGTLDAVQDSDEGGVRLGGSRKRVAILFADIRGYTAFSENREPEVVVDILNLYFADLGAAVEKNNGDIDKFVGDQLMAVFQGKNMSEDAVRCAAEIQQIMILSAQKNPDCQLDIGIGLDVGEVVMGAMGSANRMDYTVLGDHVNVAARLCSAAEPKQNLVSEAVYNDTRALAEFSFQPLQPIEVKGKSDPIRIFQVSADKLVLST